MEERAALVDLLRSRPQGMSWIQLTGEVRRHGSARAAAAALAPAELLPNPERVAQREAALHDVRVWEQAGLDFVGIVDERYPEAVRDIHQAAPFLFVRGSVRADDLAVSVVGSRDASEQGLRMAWAVAQALVDMGISVVSGLAKGIDGAAHRATLEAGGRPVGVIATGIKRQYPAEHRALHEEVAAAGLLMSQFWPDAPPQKHNFLMRNATMSGYGVATVVIEAGEHSGARAQARMAVEHGRPVILTDLVVARTEWGAALVGRPGVHVATSVTDVTNTIHAIVSAPSRVDDMLAALVAG